MSRGIRAVRRGWSPDSSGVGPRLSKKMHLGNPRRSYVSELIQKKVREKFGKKKRMPPSLQCQQTNTNPHTMSTNYNLRALDSIMLRAALSSLAPKMDAHSRKMTDAIVAELKRRES